MLVVPRLKPIAFRPTDEIEKAIQEREKANPNIKRSKIVIEMLKESLKQKDETNYSAYPPMLFCPDDNRFYLLETIVESCKKCRHKRRCAAWQYFPHKHT